MTDLLKQQIEQYLSSMSPKDLVRLEDFLKTLDTPYP
jgi:hypothetical protein